MTVIFYTFLAVVVGILAFHSFRQRKSWAQLPTLDEYWRDHPECKTPSGPRCYRCGSKNFRSWGMLSAADKNRSISCRQCGIGLYRI